MIDTMSLLQEQETGILISSLEEAADQVMLELYYFNQFETYNLLYKLRLLVLASGGNAIAGVIRGLRGMTDIAGAVMAAGIKRTFHKDNRSIETIYNAYHTPVYQHLIDDHRNTFGDPADLIDALRLEL